VKWNALLRTNERLYASAVLGEEEMMLTIMIEEKKTLLS